MKRIKNGTIIFLIGLIGLLTIIGLELYWHYAYLKPPSGYTPQEIADLDIRPIDLNTATQQELSALSELTDQQIQNILSYREEHGGFVSIEELLNVRGIGKKTYQKIIRYITVEP